MVPEVFVHTNYGFTTLPLYTINKETKKNKENKKIVVNKERLEIDNIFIQKKGQDYVTYTR